MLPWAQDIWRRHPECCCWHVVLADGNVADDMVEFCAAEATRNLCKACCALIPLMRMASKSQRLKLAAAR